MRREQWISCQERVLELLAIYSHSLSQSLETDGHFVVGVDYRSSTETEKESEFGTKADLHFSHCANIFAAFSGSIDLAIKNLTSVGSPYFYKCKFSKIKNRCIQGQAQVYAMCVRVGELCERYLPRWKNQAFQLISSAGSVQLFVGFCPL